MPDPTVALTEVFQRALLRLTVISAATAAAFWAHVATLTPAAEDELLAELLPFIEAAQLQAVHTTDAYLSRFLEMLLGAPPKTEDLAISMLFGAAVRGGTAPDLVYRRPFGAVRHALAEGVPFDQALDRGRTVLERTARTDIALSARATAHDWMTNQPAVTGWRRVTSGHCCALCTDIASTNRVYRTEQLMPLHPDCHCTPTPVLIGERDARPQPDGSTVDDSPGLEAELHDPHVAPGDLVRVVEHGELGPLLTHAGDHFAAA